MDKQPDDADDNLAVLMQFVGWVMAGIGVVVLVIALTMDTTVSAVTGLRSWDTMSGGRVQNLELLNEQILFAIVGAGLIVCGLLVALIGGIKRQIYRSRDKER